MACTSRADRNIKFIMNSTEPNLGPGAYNPVHPSQHRVRHGVAPFSSTTERVTHAGPELTTPGPGSYTTPTGPQPPTYKKKASSVFASRTKRLEEDCEFREKARVPGPGAYGEAKNSWVKDSPAKQARKQAGVVGEGRNINWVKVSTAPSIPTHSQSHGYEEGPAGELIQQKAPDGGFTGHGHLESAGPGYYNVDTSFARAAQGKGVNFGASKSKRDGVPVSKEQLSLPGPGSYNVARLEKGGAAIQEDEGPKASAVFLSSTTRDKLSFSKNLDTPGPGTYRTTDKWAKKRDEFAIPVPDHLQAFGSTAKGKFQMAQEQHPIAGLNATAVGLTPGPGAYTVSGAFDDKSPKARPTAAPTGRTNAHGAFASTVPRFTAEAATSKFTPGPGYYTNEAKTLSTGVAHKMAGRYGIFGTTSQRFPAAGPAPAATAAAGEPPGPGSYDPKPVASAAEVRRKDPRSAVFSSKSLRLTDDPSAEAKKSAAQKTTVPPVGSYDVERNEWIKTSANQSGKGIMPAARRWKAEGAGRVPGPGHYDTSHNTIEGTVLDAGVFAHGELRRATARGLDRQGYSKPNGSQAPRFHIDIQKSRMPGPGTYDAGDGMVKKTYNITIGDTWS